jgi:small subunit ribosomal protein S16
MTRMGSKKKPFFRVVLTEARSGLLGDVVENLGTYNPRATPAQVNINKDRVEHWIKQGARPSNSVRTLMSKHLTSDLSVKPDEAVVE